MTTPTATVTSIRPEQGRPAAFFDLDKTVIAKSSTLAFSRPLYRAGFLNRRALLRAAIGQVVFMMVGADHEQIERLREQLQELTRGWDRLEIERLVRETIDEVIAPHVFAEALAVIDDHRRAGHRVVIVSSSPEEVVRPLARHIGLHEVIATRSKVDVDGRYTGEIDFYAYGPQKAQAVIEYAARHNIPLADSYAYSDSATDLPMLEAVGHPVAVNPDRELRQLAQEREWQTMEFERPVTLRTRLATLPTPVPIVSGAALAAAAGAVVLVLLLRNRQTKVGLYERFFK
ncbi:MAG: HAD family hydrolase [Acidimicrobiia bacterium]